MRGSFFSYPPSRLYPLSWFKWVIIIGAVVTVTVFPVIIIAVTGHKAEPFYSTNPNRTRTPDAAHWFQSKQSPQCQDNIISVGTELATNHLGSRYEVVRLERILQHDTQTLSSITYHDDILKHCKFSSFNLQVDKKNLDTRKTVARVKAYLDCMVYDGAGPVKIDLAASFDVVNSAFTSATYAISDTKQFLFNSSSPLRNHASVADINVVLSATQWAFSLQSLYLNSLYFLGTRLPDSLTYTWTRQPNQDPANESDSPSVGITIVQTLDRRPQREMVVPVDKWLATYGFPSSEFRPEDHSNEAEYENWSASLADGFSKAIMAMILADLGQPENMNVLGSPIRLLTALQGWAQFHKAIDGRFHKNTTQTAEEEPEFVGKSALTLDIDLSRPDDFFTRTGLSPPAITPTTFSVQYLCTTPGLDLSTSLLARLLLAELVILSAFWIVYTWITPRLAEYQRLACTFCQRCQGYQCEETGRAASTDCYSVLDQNAPYEPYVDASSEKSQQKFSES